MKQANISKFLTIHGHFYQPPRANPWLNIIETQDSATPFHDWNERINRECYAPNSVARILDEAGLIKKIVNNFELISFNIGPTLLAWIEENDAKTYRRILEADKKSIDRFSGHGNAIAQCYNHQIMPLATVDDQITQIEWGIADFESRFQRMPEGIWLPETAASKNTLNLLARAGMKFTILSPHQAKAIRNGNDREFTPLNGIDPTKPYKVSFDDNLSIAIFFYDAPISQAIAFEELLNSSEVFLKQIMGGYSDDHSLVQLLPVATDGETFGHHQRFGEMALASMLDQFANSDDRAITNFGEFLELFPPTTEVEIYENSSWSCMHGVGRWQDDCGCKMDATSNQKWRRPLRNSLNILKESADRVFQEEGSKIFRDINAAKRDYIRVILDSSTQSEFLNNNIVDGGGSARSVKGLQLLEISRNSMLMFTSCGWFFDDISGIETIQILKYAARVIQLLDLFSNDNINDRFLHELSTAISNYNENETGLDIWRNHVITEQVSFKKVLANYAITAALNAKIDYYNHSYHIQLLDSREESYLENEIKLYKINIQSKVTTANEIFIVASLQIDKGDITAFARPVVNQDQFDNVAKQLFEQFPKKSMVAFRKLIDNLFSIQNSGSIYHIKDLFSDLKRKIVSHITKNHADSCSMTYIKLFNEYRRVIENYDEPLILIPNEFKIATKYVLKSFIEKESKIKNNNFDISKIVELLNSNKKWELEIPDSFIASQIESLLLAAMNKIVEHPQSELIDSLIETLITVEKLGYKIDCWDLENIFFEHYYETINGKLELKDHTEKIKKLSVTLNFAI